MPLLCMRVCRLWPQFEDEEEEEEGDMAEVMDTESADEDEGEEGRGLQGTNVDLQDGDEGGEPSAAQHSMSWPPVPATHPGRVTPDRTKSRHGLRAPACLVPGVPGAADLLCDPHQAVLRTRLQVYRPVPELPHPWPCPLALLRVLPAGDDGGLKVQEIDAYWLQRRISQTLSSLDEHSAQRLAQEVLEALQVGALGTVVLAWCWIWVLADWVLPGCYCTRCQVCLLPGLHVTESETTAAYVCGLPCDACAPPA